MIYIFCLLFFPWLMQAQPDVVTQKQLAIEAQQKVLQRQSTTVTLTDKEKRQQFVHQLTWFVLGAVATGVVAGVAAGYFNDRYNVKTKIEALDQKLWAVVDKVPVQGMIGISCLVGATGLGLFGASLWALYHSQDQD